MIRFVTILHAAALLAFAMPLAATDEPVKIVVLGDSLTAGHLLPASEAFPVQLEAALKVRGHDVTIVNAGVSGDTSSGGLARLDWSVPEDADAVIVELGANDALRGIDPEAVRANLDAIVRRLTDRKIAVLVAGMRPPRNLGHAYHEAFVPIYAEIAEKYGALLYPYFLEGIPITPETVLEDGMHPTGKGVGLIVEGILPLVEDLIARARQS